MRWLFLFVLALNLAYITWQLNREPEVPAARMQAFKGVPTIVLLSEQENEAPASQPGVEPAVATGAPEQVPEEAVESVPETPVAEVTGAPTVAAMDDTGATAGGIPAVVEATSGESAAPEAGAVDKPPAAAAVVASRLPRCYTLGPFRDLDKLRALTRDIKAYVETADFRGKEETEQSLYWVYIKPLKSRKEAIATGKRLRARKIKDFYIIREGENINGISLGYFRNKNGAQGLVKKVRKQGFDASLEPVFKTYTVYWLDYRLAAEKSIPRDVIEKHMKLNKRSEIKNMERECPAL